MSFFGFDAKGPHNRGHPTNAPGFGQTQDPFAGLPRNAAPEDGDGDAIDFDDTYDGLGDQLDEANDNFNDDTFGGTSSGQIKPVGKDFDFFGRTANVSDAISEEQMRYTRQQAPPKSVASFAASPPRPMAKPVISGYEKYKHLDHVSDLQVDPNLWGTNAVHNRSPSNQQQSYSVAPPPQSKKMMSLEEVEEQMKAQARQKAAQVQISSSSTASMGRVNTHPSQQRAPQSQEKLQPVTQVELPATAPKALQILHRPQSSFGNGGPQQQFLQGNPPFHVVEGQMPATVPSPAMSQNRKSGLSGLPRHQQIITHPQQLMQMSDGDRAAFLIEDAKRAKRNHKIFLLSKDNGLMTPQDKNFITRIQLQQLMTATGNVNEQDPDAALAEDFYYQVHSQIRGGPRQNPHQPLNHFAQTYLFQTGGRHGGSDRRRNRGGDNHMQRMEQQVQRAVEAAKLKPKNKQLVIEGSLGKISFSNAKTPKPLLNIKRHESGDVSNRPQSSKGNAATREINLGDRKSTLRDIEKVYSVLMNIEDNVRKEPMAPAEDSDPEVIQQHTKWRNLMQVLNEKLWNALKVLEPINTGSSVPHPFIAILSYPKGKKAIPRVFRHLSTEQRVTMLTMIVLHLDILDVIRFGQLQPGEIQLPTTAREAVDLFSAAVTPSLFFYVSEAPLFNVIGLLGLILDRVNVQTVAKTRVGLSILTMLTSRATLVKETGEVEEAEWQQWSSFYNRLFDTLEPVLGGVFPGSANTGEDMYVWQFLAAIGSGASPEQQQRLVIAVKDRVMETVTISKTLPPEMASQRLGNVNLFMRAIGLDVELLG